MQLIWPELVSARLSWVAGVLAHSHGFLTHDTILHSQWVAFHTRCVGPASELVVKSDSDSLVEVNCIQANVRASAVLVCYV